LPGSDSGLSLLRTMDCKHKRTERAGLYIMVFLCLLNSCSADYRAGEALRILEQRQSQ
jgi:hypothetical protein